MITSYLSSSAPRSHLNHAILTGNFSRALYSPGQARATMMADHLLRLLGPHPSVVVARKSGSQVVPSQPIFVQYVPVRIDHEHRTAMNSPEFLICVLGTYLQVCVETCSVPRASAAPRSPNSANIHQRQASGERLRQAQVGTNFYHGFKS